MSSDEPSTSKEYRKSRLVAELRRDLPFLVTMFFFIVINLYLDFTTFASTQSAWWKWFAAFDGIGAISLALLFRFYLVNVPRKPLIADRAEDDRSIRRRLRNKRWNERMKLLANMLNAIGASSFLALTLVPIIQGHAALSAGTFSGLAFAITLHICGQVVLSLTRTEE